MSAYYPAFYGFKLMDKLLLGVLSTIAIGSLQPAYIIFAWNIMLIYIIYKNTKNKGQYVLVGLMTFVTFVVSVSDRYCNHRGFYQIFNVFNDYTKVIEHISLNMNVCLIILYFICILLISFYVIKTNLGNKTMFLSFIIICSILFKSCTWILTICFCFWNKNICEFIFFDRNCNVFMC